MNFCISRFNHIHLNVATFRPQAAQEKRSQGRNIVPWYLVDLVDLVDLGDLLGGLENEVLHELLRQSHKITRVNHMTLSV